MRKLTYEEFNDRINAEQRARRIFIHMTAGDISKAFEAYQLILAETNRPINIPADSMQGMTGSEFDILPRPNCPYCGISMFIRGVPANTEDVKSQLVCSNPICDTVLDSALSILEWRDLLKKMKEEDGNGKP